MFLSFIGVSFVFHISVIGIAWAVNKLTNRKHQSAFQTYGKHGGWFQSDAFNIAVSYAIITIVAAYIFSVLLLSINLGLQYGADEPQIVFVTWLLGIFVSAMVAVVVSKFFFLPVFAGLAAMTAVSLRKPVVAIMPRPMVRFVTNTATSLFGFLSMVRIFVLVILAGSMFAVPAIAGAQILEPGFEREVVASGFSLPTATAFAADGRIFVAEKNGVVKVVKNDVVLPTPVITLTDINTFGDRGLIGMVLDPDFANNGYLYLSYTFENTPGLNPAAPKTGRIVRVTVIGDVASESSKVVLVGSVSGDATNPSCDDYTVTADCIASDSNSHSVGALTFGPDGKLYASTGDGADFAAIDPRAFRSQNVDSLAGKVLRINTDGTAPTDNPFFNGDVNANRSKVYAYGFRNMFRLRFNEVTGRLYGGDVGWSDWEEVNEIQSGNNYGWPCREGASNSPYTCTNPTADTNPLYTYPHNSAGAGAIVLGAFGVNNVYPNQYDSSLFIGDYAQQWIKRLIVNPDGSLNSVVDFEIGGVFPAEFNTGADGNVYYLDIAFGTLNRLTHTNGNRRPVVTVGSDVTSGLAPLTVQFNSTGTFDPDGDALTYAWSFGDGATSSAISPSYTYISDGVFNAALTVTDSFGAATAQSIDITVGNQAPSATIDSPANGSLYTPLQDVMVMGSAIDPEDGDLPASAFDWTVILHHNIHTHTIQQFSNTKMITFVADDHNALDVYMEIILTVTDSANLTNTKSINMYLNNGGGSGNLISNPSLETPDPIIPSQPLNWIPGWYGSMNPTFTYPVAGIGGATAAEVTVVNHNFGAARWYFAPVFVTPGETYEFSHSYKSSTSTSLTIQYARPDGTYLYNFLDILPATNDPTTTNYDIVIPADVESMTVFHDMFKNGSVTVDEYSLALKQIVDSQGPTGTITNISDNQVLSGITTIQIDAQDAEGSVTKVHLYVDGAKYGTLEDTTEPFTLDWDTTEVADGTYVIRGHMHDQVDNHGLTPEVTVIVNNGTTTPGQNLVFNGDFELVDGTGGPQGWTSSFWGTHSQTHTFPAAGRNGGNAAQVDIVSYTVSDTGDSKWAHIPINVTPGTEYFFNTYYKSDTISDVIAQYTLTDGSFVYQGIGKEILPAADWTLAQGSFIAPANAVSMTPFHLISSVGTLTIDDVVITASSTGNPSETNPPLVAFTSHQDNDQVSGQVTFVASSTDDTAVVGVYFALNGNPVGVEDFVAPYEVVVDTTAYSDGTYVLKATSHDPFGNNNTDQINIIIDNGSTTPPTGNNLVANPDFEFGTTNNPNNWSQGGWGTNDRTFSYPVVGQSGNAARIDITTYNSGDAKWFFDDVIVTGGDTIPFSNYYRSDVATELVARFTDASSAVTYGYLAAVPASTAWTQNSLDIDVPATAVSMTVFHNLNNAGYLEVDSYTLGGSGTTTPPVDTEDPVVSITNLQNDDVVTGVIQVQVNATDDQGVAFVHLIVDEELTANDNIAPYNFVLDTTNYTNGPLVIRANAFDQTNFGNSLPVTVIVDNGTTTPPTGENLIINGDFETDSLLIPFGWRAGGWGDNESNFFFPVAGSPGDAAGIVMTDYTSGDRKFYFEDVAVVPGETYTYNQDYRADVPTDVTVRYTNVDDSVQYEYIAGVAASTDWVSAPERTFQVPAGVISMTVFHTLSAVGFLEIDNATLIGAAGTTTPPVDTEDPIVDFSNLSDGDVVSGSITVDAVATDNVGVTSVTLLVDGAAVDADGSSPYNFTLDTTTLTDGAHLLLVTASDAAGNVGQSDEISVTVDNSTTTPPTGPNLISNADFESGGASPDDWSQGGWGTNDRTFTYPITGETGNGARVEIANYTSGDAKWYFTDVAVSADTTYTFSTSYQSDTSSNVVVRYTLADDSVQYAFLGTESASADWKTATYQLTTPTQAVSLTVFHTIDSVGYLETDTVSLLKN